MVRAMLDISFAPQPMIACDDECSQMIHRCRETPNNQVSLVHVIRIQVCVPELATVHVFTFGTYSVCIGETPVPCIEYRRSKGWYRGSGTR